MQPVTPRPRFGRRAAALTLAGVVLVAVGIVAWTRRETPLPPGYVLACLAAALFVTMSRWPTGSIGEAVRGAAVGLILVLLIHIFYGPVPLVSVAVLQALVVWGGACGVAPLIHAGLIAARGRGA